METVKEKILLDTSRADADRTHRIGLLLKNQIKLDPLLLSLYGATTGEKFI